MPAAKRALAGMVSTQATRMWPATPQRTALALVLAPTPMMAPLMTWVVETGMPRCAVEARTTAEAVSATKPWMGRSFTMKKRHLSDLEKEIIYDLAAILGSINEKGVMQIDAKEVFSG